MLDGTARRRREVAALRLRAAQLALDAGDAARATALLAQVEQALPQLGVVADLLAAARRRAGDARPPPRPRRAEPPSRRRRPPTRSRAWCATPTSRPRTATAPRRSRSTSARSSCAPAIRSPRCRSSASRRSSAIRRRSPRSRSRSCAPPRTPATRAAKADAYELLAHIDAELRGDPARRRSRSRAPSQADPTRDRSAAPARARTTPPPISSAELLRLRERELDASAAGARPRDRAALLSTSPALAERDQRPDAELAELYRARARVDPTPRLALFHLESIVRRERLLAELAAARGADRRRTSTAIRATQAAFLTRAGETLAELGQIDEAVQRFGKAEAVLPGHVPALEGWRQAALKGQLWIDVAEAATRQAAGDRRPTRSAPRCTTSPASR